MRTHLTLEERFWSHVDPCRTDGCAVWTKGFTTNGYGRLNIKGHYRLAHHILNGKAPQGLEWDHLCRNRACVWPDHLEAVTHQVNMLRGFGVSGISHAKTHCPQGHPYAGSNLHTTPKGERRCIACWRRRNHERLRPYVQHCRNCSGEYNTVLATRHFCSMQCYNAWRQAKAAVRVELA